MEKKYIYIYGNKDGEYPYGVIKFNKSITEIEEAIGYPLSIMNKTKDDFIYYDEELETIMDKVGDYEIIEKYIIFYDQYGEDSECYIFLDEKEAVDYADYIWNHLSDHDKKNNKMYVGLCTSFKDGVEDFIKTYNY